MTAAAAKADIGHNSASVGELLDERPAALYDDPSMLQILLDDGEKAIADFKADLTTDKGRKAIASFARKFATRKTALDEAGKEMNSSLRKKIDVVDDLRRKLRDGLDKLRDKARAPLDAYEQREEDRKLYVTETRALYADAMRLSVDAGQAGVDEMVRQIEQRAIHPEMLAELLDTTLAEQKAALAHLVGLSARIKQDEADRAELARLRAEKEETERQERERIAKEAAAKAEQERIAAVEKAVAERAEAEVKRKAEEAEKAAQAKRDAEAAEERRKAQAAIDEANRKAREAEEARLAVERKAQAEQAERDRLAAAEKARIAAEEAAAERRRKDQEHRSTIMRAAKEAMMEHGKVTEDQAKALVLAIVGGSIPNVSLEF